MNMKPRLIIILVNFVRFVALMRIWGMDFETDNTTMGEHPIQELDRHALRKQHLRKGVYYEFQTNAKIRDQWTSQVVYRGQWSGPFARTPCANSMFAMASLSKVFTGMAVMRAMELYREITPDSTLSSFGRLPGMQWWAKCQFRVRSRSGGRGSHEKYDLTIRQLVTHTSGLPFVGRLAQENLPDLELSFLPNQGYGYSIGHRVMGWFLKDFLKKRTVAEALSELLEPLQLNKTNFAGRLAPLFGNGDAAGDASVDSTARDLMQIALVALRRGRLADNTPFVSQRNWEDWAMRNHLPGLLSEQMVDWDGGLPREQIMKQGGRFGWSFFGGTYHNTDGTTAQLGWCGFFASCIRISFIRNIAFVMTQRDVADQFKKTNRLQTVEGFEELIDSLRCKARPPHDGQVFCQVCTNYNYNLQELRHCPTGTRHGAIRFKPSRHPCYVLAGMHGSTDGRCGAAKEAHAPQQLEEDVHNDCAAQDDIPDVDEQELSVLMHGEAPSVSRPQGVTRRQSPDVRLQSTNRIQHSQQKRARSLPPRHASQQTSTSKQHDLHTAHVRPLPFQSTPLQYSAQRTPIVQPGIGARQDPRLLVKPAASGATATAFQNPGVRSAAVSLPTAAHPRYFQRVRK